MLLPQIRTILLDACNLQLSVEPTRPSTLRSSSIGDLPRRLHLLSRYLSYLDPWGDELPSDSAPPAAVTAVFGGSALFGAHAGATWFQRDELEGAPASGNGDGIHVAFTAGTVPVLLQFLTHLVQGQLRPQRLRPQASVRSSAFGLLTAMYALQVQHIVRIMHSLRLQRKRAIRKNRDLRGHSPQKKRYLR